MAPPRRNPKGAWVLRAIAALLVVNDAPHIASSSRLIWNDLSSYLDLRCGLPSSSVEAERAVVEALCRRLIILIFADRASRPAVMVVIRRDLPRTRDAGPAKRPVA